MKTSKTLLVALLLLAAPVSAQTAQKPRDTYTADELAKVEAARDAAQKRLSTLEKAAKSAQREVSDIETDLLIAAADSSRREEAANGAEERLMLLSSDLETARSKLTGDQAAIEDLLAALMSFGSRRPPALAASPEDTGAAVRAAILMGDAAPALSKRAATLKAQIDDINRLAAETLREREILVHEEAALAARREEIAALAAEKRLSSASLAAETRTARAETQRLAAEAETLRDLLDGLAKSAPSMPGRKPELTARTPAPKAPTAKPAAPGTGPPPAPPPTAVAAARLPATPGAPLAPALGTRKIRFGETIDGARQEGLTLATRSAAQVVAPLDARVQYAGVFRTYGQMLILDVGGDVLVIVAGLDALYPEAGQWVLAGEPVGRMATRSRPLRNFILK